MGNEKTEKKGGGRYKGISPSMDDMGSIYDFGLTMIDKCVDSNELITLILDEYERRFNEMPTTAIVPKGDSTQEKWEKEKVKSLMMFATQAVSLKEKSLFIRQLKEKNHALKRAMEEQKRLEAELVEAERLKAILQVVGTLNHEINNPLTVILGRSQLLSRKFDPSDKKILRSLRDIKEEAERIRDVVFKLSKVIKPSTKEYVSGITIIDTETSLLSIPDKPTDGD